LSGPDLTQNRPSNDKVEKIRNRFFHDDRDLRPRSQCDAGQTRKRLYMKGRWNWSTRRFALPAGAGERH